MNDRIRKLKHDVQQCADKPIYLKAKQAEEIMLDMVELIAAQQELIDLHEQAIFTLLAESDSRRAA
jgi:hypothetical protein